MRALIVALALAVVVVICTAFVVLFAGLNVSPATLASIGLGIFMIAALFASIAALGPKARPTPLLTPAIGGTAAAALTTVVIIAGSTQFGQAHRAAMETSEPARVTAPAPEVAVAPAPEIAAAPASEEPQAPPEPEPILFPGVTIVPAGPLPGPASRAPNADVRPMETPEPSAPESTEQAAPMAPSAEPDGGEAAADTPTADPNPVGLPADSASEKTAAETAAPSAVPTASPIPIPPIPTPPPARFVLSEDAFDTSKPPALHKPIDGVSPPLPRSRPCGAGGPPCP